MLKIIPVVAILLAGAAMVQPETRAPLTTIREINHLSRAEAALRLPVAFEGTVTSFRRHENLLFVQDGELATFVLATTNTKLLPGDRVRIKGTTRGSFKAIVTSDDITVLRHGEMPKAIPVHWSDLILGQHDCVLVKMSGVVRAADLVMSPRAPIRSITIQMLVDGGYVDATIDSDNLEAMNGLLDAEVEVTGAAGGRFDDKMQQTGIVLHVPSSDYIKILKPADLSVWNTPITPMSQILGRYRVIDRSSRIRVQGTITYYHHGSVVVLESGGKSLWIRTGTDQPLHVGDLADAIGFPDVIDGFLTLTHAEIKDSYVPALVEPVHTVWKELAVPSDRGLGHHYDLVTIEGQVITQAREGAQDEYVVIADGHPFSAIYQHPSGQPPPMKMIPLGSKVRVTGICTLHDSNPFSGPVAFDLLMRSFDDIVVVTKPSILNTRNLLYLVGLMLILVFGVLVRGWALERRVRQKTAALAKSIEAEAALQRRSALLEQKRSQILEHINGARPLSDILEEIVAMVSFTLEDAACWYEAADGSRLGQAPLEQTGLRILHVEIEARSGPPLGRLYAGFSLAKPPMDGEIDALQNGARLATLTIETRCLYRDLRHRSEYDLLTDIPNRFAMEKFIHSRIEEAEKNGDKLGLIYIDLDKFKPINDRFGHHVGDLFLQAVALRMSKQLLGSDMLARLGGDEFAALVSLQHGRSDLDRIVARLKHCFVEPFSIDGHCIHGAASIGYALYPQDGTTRDELLNAADNAMYEVKKKKKQAA